VRKNQNPRTKVSPPFFPPLKSIKHTPEAPELLYVNMKSSVEMKLDEFISASNIFIRGRIKAPELIKIK